MATHLLVAQLRFARGEFQRCLQSVSEADGCRRLQPMNCISWIVGHLAHHEQVCWVQVAQGQMPYPSLGDRVGYGKPASTPPLEEMWAAWREVTAAADRYLDTLTPERLETYLQWEGELLQENVGTMLLRNIYHYWFHLGEAHAVRQMLGHAPLPDFVGDMSQAAYRREG